VKPANEKAVKQRLAHAWREAWFTSMSRAEIFRKIDVNRCASSRVIRRRCRPKLSGIQP